VKPEALLPDALVGESIMHSATCPTCGTRVEVDFVPVAGQVWCPTCQKLFSPSVGSEPGETGDRAEPNNDES
jgi:uncharacterized Zn finger protein (UPF0148 family)